jgi:hypothetical protein
MLKHAPNWQAKDLIVLFYEDTDYSFGVKEFLEHYYFSQGDQSNND